MKYLKSFKMLCEKSFNYVNVQGILTPRYINNYIKNNDIDYLIEIYCDDNELDYDDEHVPKSKGFKEFLKNELSNRLEDFENDIYEYVDFGKYIHIYREMMVDDEWFETLKPNDRLGEYWSWKKDAAEAHGGDYDSDKKTVLIECRIREDKDVDWKGTIEFALDLNLFEECEVALKPNTKLRMTNVWIDGELKDITHLKTKIFKA